MGLHLFLGSGNPLINAVGLGSESWPCGLARKGLGGTRVNSLPSVCHANIHLLQVFTAQLLHSQDFCLGTHTLGFPFLRV